MLVPQLTVSVKSHNLEAYAKRKFLESISMVGVFMSSCIFFSKAVLTNPELKHMSWISVCALIILTLANYVITFTRVGREDSKQRRAAIAISFIMCALSIYMLIYEIVDSQNTEPYVKL